MAFISKVADYIIDKYDLTKESLDVVFPNKRAALTLRKELAKRIKKNIWLPRIVSIQEAMTAWSGLQLIDNIDVIFELLKIFSNSNDLHLKNDSFGLAAQMAKDFDEIDQYAVDANNLFNYLTEIKKLEMWTPDESNPIESSYIRFFSSLIKYYNSLRNSLLKNNCGYYGLITRMIYNLSKKEFEAKIGDRKLIFAGFNALTYTEEQVIVRLIDSGKGMILWDLDKYYYEDVHQEAGFFARRFFEKHHNIKSLFIGDSFAKESKEINIIGVSGDAVQTNALQLQLNNEFNNINKKQGFAEVIVLVDETLLIPVLNSIPIIYDEIQVTMGYPYNKTLLHQFIVQIFKFQQNLGKKDETIYYWSFVKLINTEIIKLIFPSNDLRLLFKWQNKLAENSIYYIKKDEFDLLKENKNLSQFINLCIKKWNSSSDCLLSFKELLKFINIQINNIDSSNFFIKNQISTAGRIINRLEKLFNKYSFYVQIPDLETLYEQIATEITIRLNGSHEGLQIMGLLETRNLDFDIVHILSVNEGTLPQSKNNNSLIPYELRVKYNLPTYKNQQAVYAYHFYRLIQNAHRINLYYNNLDNSMGQGEPSRFIRQLLYEYPSKCLNTNIVQKYYKSPAIKISNAIEIKVKKSKEIIRKILDKISEDKDGLSPTSISCYLNCPLQFYLKYIEKLKDNTSEEIIQANVIGSIIHDTLQLLYENFSNREIDRKIYNEVVEKFYDESYNKALIKNNFPNGLPETGFNYLTKKIIIKMIENFIKFEKKSLENGRKMKILELEKKLLYIFDSQGHKVKLTGRIDRIDMIDGIIRIIDYKTGNIDDKDIVVEKKYDDMNKLNDKSLQLLIYKFLYLKENKNVDSNQIISGIFGLRKPRHGIFTLDVRQDFLNKDFMNTCEEYIKGIYDEILNENIPFVQVDDEKKCLNCDFQTICKRYPKKYY